MMYSPVNFALRFCTIQQHVLLTLFLEAQFLMENWTRAFHYYSSISFYSLRRSLNVYIDLMNLQVHFAMKAPPFYVLGLYSPCGPWPLFRSPNLFTIGRTPWASDRPVARPLPKHRTAQAQKNTYAHQHPCPEWDSNPRSQHPSEQSSCLRPRGYRDRLASERAKTVHALDRSATVTGDEP
jgi:hypothetical protein